MSCASHLRVFVLATATVLLAGGELPARATGSSLSLFQSSATTQEPATLVHLSWGARAGVLRYRLQLATDSEFSDIIFDRVVSGNQYGISDLTPGRYFWRVAALTARPLEFSSAGVIDVHAETLTSNRATAAPSPRPLDNARAPSPASLDRVATGDGWRALIGDVSSPVLAHLRSASALDLIAIGSQGVVYALDGDSGIALWTARPRVQLLPRTGAAAIVPLLVKSHAGTDNVVVLSSNAVFALDGATGRELWRTALPAPAASGEALGSELFIIDNSLHKLILIDGGTGKLMAQVELSARTYGAPVAFDRTAQRGVLIAFEDGRVELHDVSGKTIRSGNAGSPATTRPLFVSGPRGGLVLLGTRSGLTAFDGEDFHPLGRVTLKDDAPRGTLAAADLDGDGTAEVVMLTEHGRVVAVNAVDGKILWESASVNDAQSVAFADVDGDRVLDVVMAGGQVFATALSGRDGSVVWKEDEPPTLAANHAASFAPRSVLAGPHGSGILLISSDPSRTGLRAVGFPRGTVRPLSR